MEAKFYKMGEHTVIKLSGRIQPDQNKPFRDMCEQKLKSERVIFCLEQLSFTASANILTFFESIRMIEDVKVVGLQHDFFRLLELRGLSLNTYASMKEALLSINEEIATTASQEAANLKSDLIIE